MALTVICSAVPAGSLEEPTAAFIETHSEEQLSIYDYWHAAVSFNKIGFKANLLSPYTGVQRIHPDNLTEFVSILLITPRDGSALSTDIEMILDYVAAGNGLIVAGQGSKSDYEPWARGPVNELTAEFGIEFNRDTVCDPADPYLSDPRYPQWPMLTRFADQLADDGIERVSYHAGCSLSLSGNATPAAWTSGQAWKDLDGDFEMDDDESQGECTLAALSTYGEGRVACIGDNNLWSSRFLNGFDNNAFLLSMLEWVSGDVGQAEAKGAILDTTPTVERIGDGNYSADVEVRVWNQGTEGVEAVNLYKHSGTANLTEGNVSADYLGPGDVMDFTVPAHFSGPGEETLTLAFEYNVSGSRQLSVLRAITLSVDSDLYHLSSLLGNGTEIVYGDSSLGNVSGEELWMWANRTRDIIAESYPDVEVFNHTEVASKSGTRYDIDGQHLYRDLVSIGGPESNLLSAHVSQEGRLRMPESVSYFRLLAGPDSREYTLEESRTAMPRLDGNLSDWGYLSMYSESGRGLRLAVGGFGRKGVESSVNMLWEILEGRMDEYSEELTTDVVLFRASFDGQGQIVDVDFY
jgi:hypothetical protein